MLKKSLGLQHMDIPRTRSYMGSGRHVVGLWTVPDLGMADREFELWTGSNMDLSDLVPVSLNILSLRFS